MSCAALRVEKRSSGRASSTGRPRTWSATRRALRGATRTKRARALTTGRSGASFFAARRRAGALPDSLLAFAELFFSAGFFSAACLAGASAVAVSAASLSAVFEVASAAVLRLPRVAVSSFGFAEERVPVLRRLVPELPDLAEVFRVPPEPPDDFFVVERLDELCFFSVSFFSSAIATTAPRRYRRLSAPGTSGWGRTPPACGRPSTPRCRPARAC